jgi:DNA-binding response OmpR family regulator
MENTILIIEDDIAISEMVMNHLTKEGFIVERAFDGEEGINKFLKNNFDLVLLDIMLPKLDGIEVLKIFREKSSVPILIMSAKDSDLDKAVGLSLGGDDYISKPFSLIEVTARVKAAIRRATKYSNSDRVEENKILSIHELTIDLNNFSVIKNGDKLQLTAKEFEILKLFVLNPKRVFTKEQLYSSIWKDDYYGDENVINVHMRRLREKIEDNPSEPKYIKTLWGIGYRFGEFK